MENFEDFLHATKTANYIVCDDFNNDWLSEPSSATESRNLVQYLGYQFLTSFTTRKTLSTSICIDHSLSAFNVTSLATLDCQISVYSNLRISIAKVKIRNQ